MILLITGLVLWSGLHFMPAIAQGLRNDLIASLGDGKYRLIYSLIIVVSIILIVFGYRAMPQGEALYQFPKSINILANILMLIAFMLFGATHTKSNIYHYIRHPQLTSIVVWACAHLLANGEPRAILLFGVLALWAVLEIVILSRRQGAWQRPVKGPLANDLKPSLIGLIMFAVLMLAHPFLFGVSPILNF